MVKPIIGYEGLYEITDDGVVFSVDRYTKDGKHLKRKEVKGGKCSNGYEFVCLRKDGVNHNCLKHRLVAEAFISNPNNLPVVNHKDGNIHNNNVYNLEWCTQKYNINYGTGIAKRAKTQSKKVLQFKPDGTFVKEWESIINVQRNLGFCQSHISKCCRGKYAHAYGYIWKYKKEIE